VKHTGFTEIITRKVSSHHKQHESFVDLVDLTLISTFCHLIFICTWSF